MVFNLNSSIYRISLPPITFISKLPDLIKKCNILLKFYNLGAPVISPCKKGKNIVNSTVNTYGAMILNVLMYICNGKDNLLNKIKKYLFNIWKNDLVINARDFIFKLSARNSAAVQNYLGVSSAKMEGLNNIFKYFYGTNIFQSRAEIDKSFKLYKPPQDRFVNVKLKPEKANKKKSLKQLFLTAYTFSLLVAVSINLDGWINNNIFNPLDILFDDEQQILVNIGSDRCDVDQMGCYSLSVCVNGGVASSAANRSTVPLLIFGSFDDESRSITSVYNKSDFDIEMNALNRLPAALSIVKYYESDSDNLELIDKNHNQSIPKGNYIVSRESVSCVLAFDTKIHQSLNNQLIQHQNERRQLWKNDHPIKKIDHEKSNCEISTEQICQWEYRKNNDRHGISQFKNHKSVCKREKVLYNWWYSLEELKKHLKQYTYPIDHLFVQGYCNSEIANTVDSEMIQIINESGKRTLGENDSDLPFVCDFNFTNGV